MNFRGKTAIKKRPTEQVAEERPRSLEAYMAKQVVSFSPDQDIWQAIEVMLKKGVSGGPVLDKEGRLVGILSEKDCLRVLIDTAYNNHPHQKDKVALYMSSKVISIPMEQDIFDVAKAFLNSNYRRFPVLDKEGRLRGQISRRDVMRAAQKFKGTRW